MRRLSGFSLMEMMTTLLIISIVAAATAPMINKKMTTNTNNNASPWRPVADGHAYNLTGSDNITAIIGDDEVHTNNRSRLHIRSTGKRPQITLSNNDSTDTCTPAKIAYNNTHGILFGNGTISATGDPSVAIGNSPSAAGVSSIAIGTSASSATDYSIALGKSASATTTAGAIAIGNAASASTVSSGSVNGPIAIGANAEATDDAGIAIGSTAISKEGDLRTRAGYNSIAIGLMTQAVDIDGIAMGSQANAGNTAIALGYWASASGQFSTAIGESSSAAGEASLAIGQGANATNGSSIAIGDGANASGLGATAIGDGTNASSQSSTAIGNGAKASHLSSTAIGAGAETSADKQIVLGTPDSTVYIPGNLVVGRMTYLGVNETEFSNAVQGTSPVALVLKTKYEHKLRHIYEHGGDNNDLFVGSEEITLGNYPTQTSSDRRLKNVGKAFTGGLAELKKLDLFHYTYKKDESKTPHVGVMAQDLQKVFPDAVNKGTDGFLRIRLEDMFYALINSVKELDAKIENLKNNEILVLKNRVDKLESENKKLIKQNQNFEKRLAELEKKVK